MVIIRDIASVGLDGNRENVLARDTDTHIAEITEQIHVNAGICERKFRHYRYGLVASVMGVSLLVLLAVVCSVC